VGDGAQKTSPPRREEPDLPPRSGEERKRARMRLDKYPLKADPTGQRMRDAALKRPRAAGERRRGEGRFKRTKTAAKNKKGKEKKISKLRTEFK